MSTPKRNSAMSDSCEREDVCGRSDSLRGGLPELTRSQELGKSRSVDKYYLRQSIRIEHKHFTFDLKENHQGIFLRISEEVNGRYDAIIIPTSGIEQFRDKLDEVMQCNKKNRYSHQQVPAK